jgi:hypothetical protein
MKLLDIALISASFWVATPSFAAESLALSTSVPPVPKTRPDSPKASRQKKPVKKKSVKPPVSTPTPTPLANADAKPALRWVAHVGPAYVFQHSAGNNGQSLGMRGFFSWLLTEKNNFSARYLGTFKSVGSIRFSNPQWAMLTWERRICGGLCGSSSERWVPRFYGVLGLERYTNFGQDDQTGARFIQSYLAPVIGFRTRFDLYGPWEIGGDLLYNRISDRSDLKGSKWHVQGDISYNSSSTRTFGVGYWVEWAKVPLRNVTERSVALETFVEFKF